MIVFCLICSEKADYEQGHLPGAVYADWETLEQNIDTILEQQEKEIRAIVLYCDRGNISLIVARDLVRKGYPAISVGADLCAVEGHWLV